MATENIAGTSPQASTDSKANYGFSTLSVDFATIRRMFSGLGPARVHSIGSICQFWGRFARSAIWSEVTLHPFPILYEDNHLLIVNKPADWVVQGAQGDQRSVLESARRYLKQKYHKPGNVFLGVVSRLDAPVTGVVPFARTSKGAARLSEQFRARTPRKLYLALVEGVPARASGRVEHFLVRPSGATVTRVAGVGDRDSQQAILEYRLVESHAGQSLVEIQLITGRKHQIRCQMAALGTPILGDRIYGSRTAFPEGIALHCRQLTLEHPTRGTPIESVAPLPRSWPSWAQTRYLP